MDPTSLTGLLMYGGALAACLVFIVGLMRRYWMMMAHHLEVKEQLDKRISEKDAHIIKTEKERDDWHEAYLRAVNQGDRAIGLAHKVKE